MNTNYILTGNTALDSILSNGIPNNKINVIVGQPNSNSLLCMKLYFLWCKIKHIKKYNND